MWDVLLRAEPALLGDVEDHAVGVLVLDLEVGLVLGLAQREEELAASGLDALLRLLQVLDLEAEVVHADEARRVREARSCLALVLEQREIDHAVGEVAARAHLEVFLADAVQVEDLLVERGGALEVLDHDRDVPELRHACSIASEGRRHKTRIAPSKIMARSRDPLSLRTACLSHTR